MKNYRLTIFSQDRCNPCIKLKDHIGQLPEDWRLELELLPFKDADGEPTSFASSAGVTQTPTLVVFTPRISCEHEDGDEFCSVDYVPVESVVGAREIIRQLPALLDGYTYAIPE